VGGLVEIVRTLGTLLPLRALAIVCVVVLLLGLPAWFENVRERQIRGTVRRMVRADPPIRASLEDRALELAGGKARRLTVLAGEAIRYDQRSVRDRALAALDASGADTKALRDRIDRPKIRFRDPVEAVVRVEALLADGLTEAAREQLDAARRAFPDDPELAALQDKLPA
jgi:hypothetical protein